jgi:hypothetical protein
MKRMLEVWFFTDARYARLLSAVLNASTIFSNSPMPTIVAIWSARADG